MKKNGVLRILCAIIIAFTLLVIGVALGSNKQDIINFMFPATETPLPTFTATPTSTLTPTSTSTPIPTKAPGEFPYNANDVLVNFQNKVGLLCTESATTNSDGLIWKCIGVEGYNELGIILYGHQDSKIDYIYTWVLNTTNPDPNMASAYLNIVTSNLMDSADSKAIDTKVSSILTSISGLGEEIVTDTVNGYQISITGPGICRVLTIGKTHNQEIDQEILSQLINFEMFCRYSPSDK